MDSGILSLAGIKRHIHVVTPSGGDGNVRALLIMREQKASPMLGPFGNNGPGGIVLSYYQSTR
jgi:hypothetical protein